MKSTIFAVLRMVLSGLGAYLLGKNLFGTTIDESLWEMIVGSVMIVISLVSTILDKTSSLERREGVIRQSITALGGLVTSLGIIKEETVATISTIVVSLLPYILSELGKKKSQDVAVGNLGLKDLTGVNEVAKTESIAPVLNTPIIK